MRFSNLNSYNMDRMAIEIEERHDYPEVEVKRARKRHKSTQG